ncbi:hypothetical protein NUSPORA_00388 [Nucleospora cyclopteri]
MDKKGGFMENETEILKKIVEKREFDIIVYGSSSFTGKYVIKELEKSTYNVALSGRNIDKIHKSSFKKIQCDIENIEDITKRTRVLLNLAGPFALLGEKIIQACVKTNTDYVDINGEVGFMKSIQENYDYLAKSANQTVLMGCGFDATASDLGAYFLAKNFDQCKIRGFLSGKNCVMNSGTWNSFLESMRNFHNKKKPAVKNKKSYYQYDEEEKAYLIKFVGPDGFVVKNSANYFKNFFNYNYEMYFKTKSFFSVILMVVSFFLVNIFVQFSFTYYLLKTFPSFFTFGTFKSNGPSEETVKKGSFELKMTATGEREGKKCKQTLIISGPDAPYLSCSIFCTEACFQILKNKKNVRKGVVFPATALANTDVKQELERKGILFKFNQLNYIK